MASTSDSRPNVLSNAPADSSSSSGLGSAAVNGAADSSTNLSSAPAPGGPVRESPAAASRRRRTRSSDHSRQSSTHSRGREFRVGNVGGNGVIYLRPTKRVSIAPSSMSSFAGRKPVATPSNDPQWRDSILSATATHRSHGPRDSVTSASPPPAPRTPKDASSFPRDPKLPSTSVKTKASPSRGTFKVVIDRAGTNGTNGNFNATSIDATSAAPLYDVPIPHYRLGTPQFTGKGNAVLHSSIATGSSVVGSRRPSAEAEEPVARTAHIRPTKPMQVVERTRSASQASSEPPELSPDRLIEAQNPLVNSADVLFPKDPQKGVVGSFDVRVSPQNGQIVAASIPQLLVHITSPYRLDYDLLSDFFLTFRLFMRPADLATQLLQRLRASVGSGDGMSRIVRVRTFVALRHWILNYFVDDFVGDMQLRIQFCESVNSLCHDVKAVNSQTVGDLRILGELKRCWKHTCALFWDVPADPAADHMEQDIYPGGVLGSRSLPPDQTAAVQMEMRSRESSPSRTISRDGTFDRASHESSQVRLSSSGTHAAPMFAFNQTSALQSSASLTRSDKKSSKGDRHSMQVLSCTIPSHSKLARQPSKGPRPVESSGQTRTQTKKTQQAGDTPRRHHKRSGSFSDALRDDRAPLPAPHGSETGQSQPVQMIIPGSLIRGAMVSPVTPYVESVLPRTPIGPAYVDIPQMRRSEESVLPELSYRPGGFHTPGMRRFIGSVRRALTTRNHSTARPIDPSLNSSRNRSCSSIVSHGPALAAPLAETGLSRGELNAGPTVLRVDLLAAEIAQSFNEAVREASEAQAAATAQPAHATSDPALAEQGGSSQLQLPKAKDDKVLSNITMGSHSIIIADDTNGQATPRPDVTTFAARASEAVSSARGGQDVPVFLDTAPPSEVCFDEEGNVMSRRALDSPYLAEHRASQLSTAHNLHDVTAVSLQERVKQHGDNYAESISFSDNTSTNDPFHFERVPLHQLRRVPGGDLRAAQHVHSLDNMSLDVSNRGPSMSDISRVAPVPETSRPSQLSQPAKVKPSFEKEVAKLADLPDPTGEGGIEDALLKLEGRKSEELLEGDLEEHSAQGQQRSAHARKLSKARREGEIVEMPLGTEIDSPRTLQNLGHRTTHAGSSEQPQIMLQSKPESVSESEASHSSVPLLERGASHPPVKKAVAAEEDEEDQQNQNGRTRSNTNQSFLLDDNQSLSSLSATTPDDASDAQRSASKHSSVERTASADQGRVTTRPPSSRPTNPVARTSTSTSYRHERSHSDGDQPLAGHSHSNKSKSVNDLLQAAQPPLLSNNPSTAHLCFVLAYDSLILAQQFTVVERDALCEVEWRDLIDLKWNQSAATHPNWVAFLRSKSQEANGYDVRAGVDMCIARFNLVVRWVKSEVVLTEDLNERAATVIKYIHIARHCRRLRNWATMYQVTMALVGADISRLKRTWDLVPAKDKETLRVLEELIMPTKNFHNLREEVESATETFAQDGDGGCIPFIGIYTHDLIYNAQKPMYVPTGTEHNTTPSAFPPTTLVNFERHHTAATIVKNLLRLIEASSKYAFQPVPEVASRCLWISALTDEEVSYKSHQIEPSASATTAAAA